jgi:lipase chaperone LimK
MRVGVAGLVVLCGLAGLVIVRHVRARSPEPASSRGAATAATMATVDRPATAPDVRAGSPPEVAPPQALPGSLDGAEADGTLEVDGAGHVVIDIELRRLFDHFLAASGEEPLATIRARITFALRARLPAAAAAEGIAILERYLAYRDAARLLSPSPDLAATLDQVHDLRRKMFSPEVARAFFAEEEAATYAALARRAVALDPTLPAGERERRLAELDARVPEPVREAREAALAPLRAWTHENALRATGASAEQIAEARTAALGAGAAARLAELDKTRAAWDARLAQFRAERAVLLADARLDDAERRRRIDQLLARSFSPPERLRVEALDRMSSDWHRSPAGR